MSGHWTPNDWIAERRVTVSPDAESVARRVGKRLIRKLVTLTAAQEVVHVGLTGGRAGVSALAAAARRAELTEVNWDRVHFWWSDERFVAADDADRNDRQARDALLNAIPILAVNVHTIAASDSGLTADEAAARYEEDLAAFSSTGTEGQPQPWPSFDICLLGVGPDAHICSLFPDRAEILIDDRAAVAVHDSPKLPSTRVTLTRPVVNSSERLWLIVTGQEKAMALGLALAGASYASVPAAGAKGRRHTKFFVDTAAAADVAPELIER